MLLKEELHNFCKSFVEKRLTRIYNSIQSVQDALNSETKSSAGDKHETGRAMLQLEREKLGQQLHQAEYMNATLSRIEINTKATKIVLGSYIKTSKANYFIAISAGETQVQNQSVFCISAATPIAQLLIGKTAGDSITFNLEKIQILEFL